MNKLLLALLTLLTLYSPAFAQLGGTDTKPGDACTAAEEGHVRRNASVDRDESEITLMCDGSQWQSATGGGGLAALQGQNDPGPCTLAKDGLIKYNAGANPRWEYCHGGTTSWLPFRLPQCQNDGAGECTLSALRSADDAQFVASNILSGVNILGVTGTATAGGAACTNDSTAECTLSATRSSGDPQLVASSIRCGLNILGVVGAYGFGSSSSFTFADVANATLSTLTTASAVTISGIPAGCPAEVTVAGQGSPQISIAGGAWGTTGSISNGQTLAVRLTSSASFNTAHTATVSIGTTQDTWSVTTFPIDTTPNAFDFTPNVTNATLSTLTNAANTVTITGINTSTPVSVSGTGSPQISINGGAWTTSGTITNGQTLALRMTSSASFSTANTATVDVGGVTDTWSVTTFAIDTTPNSFTFTDQTLVPPNDLITSNAVTITGINTGTPVSVSGAGSPQISIAGGAWATSGTITSGQTLVVRLTSSSSLLTAHTATVNVGGVTDVWSVTTRSTRFIYEFGGNISGANATTLSATEGTEWDGIEKMSYLTIAQSADSNSRSFSSFLYDGAAPAWQQAAVDNGDSEHISGGMSIHNINPADTAQTVAYNMSGSVSKQFAYLRIIGGLGNLSVVYSDFRGNGPVWPYAYNIPSLQVGDIVVAFLSYRGTAGSSATNMTQVFANGSPRNLDVYATQITTAGTFSTTLSAPGRNQQWVHGIAVFREQ